MTIRFEHFAVLALIVSASTAISIAGWQYTAVTETGPMPFGSPMDGTVTVIGDENRARIDILDSRHPALKPGLYLVTRDGGRTMFAVNTNDASYAAWDMDRTMNIAAVAIQTMNASLRRFKADRPSDTPDAPLMGMPTRRYVFGCSYEVELRAGEIMQHVNIRRTETVWSAPSLKDSALAIWMRKPNLLSGLDRVDRGTRDCFAAVAGLPLKYSSVQTTRIGSNTPQLTVVTTEIRDLRPATLDDRLFEIPAGYQLKKIVLPTAPSLPPPPFRESSNPFKRFFKKLMSP